MSSASAKQYRLIFLLSGQDMSGTALSAEEAGRMIGRLKGERNVRHKRRRVESKL